MKYNLEITNKLKIINEVLDEIKVPHLLENPDFFVDKMSINSCLKINLIDKGENNIPLSLTFTPSGLEIGLDRIDEAIEWSNKDINESKVFVKSLIRNLLTSYFLVEYLGSYRTRISLFAKDGKCINVFKYYEGISFKLKRESRLYFPVYF